jgi:peptide/nickel transport system permease protein
MRRFVRERLLTTLLIVWATATLAFLALRIIPGDAITNQMLLGGASEADIARQRAILHLDMPVPAQYASYLLGLLRGDLGYSFLTQQPVSQLIAEQFGATFALASSALAVSLVLGLALGALEALDRPRWLGRLAGLISIVALSTPTYWSGTLAIFIFSIGLGILPATGSGDLRHLLLPAAVLGFHVAGSIARVTRTSLRKTLEADFVRTAHAKGLPARLVFSRHVLRAGLPSILSVVALQMGFLFGGTVITETLFARQGIGRLLQDAVLDQDYPVVQGVVVLSALIYSLVSAAADLLYGVLDPRVLTHVEM